MIRIDYTIDGKFHQKYYKTRKDVNTFRAYVASHPYTMRITSIIWIENDSRLLKDLGLVRA